MSDLAWVNQKIQQHAQEDPSVKAILQFQITAEDDTALIEKLKKYITLRIHQGLAHFSEKLPHMDEPITMTWETNTPQSTFFITRSLFNFQNNKQAVEQFFKRVNEEGINGGVNGDIGIHVDWLLTEHC